MSHDVTIVIPTRNRAELLTTTLHSIQVAIDEAQRAGWHAKVLIVDDCSEDDGATAKVAESFGCEYARIEEHDGSDSPSAAIILGVQLTTTPYLTLFGDDDFMLPRYLAAHLEKMAAGYDLCSGSYALATADLRPYRDFILEEPHLGDLLALRVGINDGAMVRTELMQAGPWDASHDQRVLYPVWVTIVGSGAKCTTLGEVTWYYRRHKSNISSNLQAHDDQERRRLADAFIQVYRDRGERIPASRAQLLDDEIEARAEQARRVAAEKQRRAEEAAALRERRKQEAWDAMPLHRKTRIRIRRRLRRYLRRAS